MALNAGEIKSQILAKIESKTGSPVDSNWEKIIESISECVVEAITGTAVCSTTVDLDASGQVALTGTIE